ncbi:MAG: iron-containing alcohol dehydrogenase, partial [Oscillospiraceae bacterium]
VFQYLPRAYTNGQDFEAREKMLVASYKAGIAFTRSCVGYVHAIAHTLGGFYGLAHGLANAVLLPVVLELYGKSAHAPLAKLADAVHLAGETEAQKAQAFIEAIRSMNAAMGIPNGFDCIRDEDMPTMVRYALAEANPTYPVPEIWGEREIRAAIDRIRI